MPQSPQILLQQGRLEDALAGFAAMLAADPANMEALFGQAVALMHLGRLAEARQGFDAVLARAPAALGALNNRGQVLLEMGALEAALADFTAALAIRPDLPSAILGRSVALLKLGRPADALPGFSHLTQRHPEVSDAWFYGGLALQALGHADKAVAAYDKALEGRPDAAVAILGNRGLALQSLKRLDEAMASFAAVEKLQPGNLAALNGMAGCAAQLCDWSRHDEFARKVLAAAGEKDIHSAIMLAYSNAPEILQANARAHARPAASSPRWTGAPFSGPKIRIAYCSADFHDHPMARLLAGMFERHDRARFEVMAISFGPEDGSAMRARLKAAFDRFEDARESSDAAIADLMAGLKVEIAVDLMGDTQNARPGLWALRPAPVVAGYMGYPGTMGSPCYDYIIADAVVAPPEQQPFYDEQIMALPDTYWGTDDRFPKPGAPPPRAEAGLPESGFVFCCFNNNWKIAPDMFAIWMRLLKAVPDSVLWLIEDNAFAAANLRKSAAAAGIAPARLVFAPRVSLQEHLARHRLAGLFLDTLPYNAHTTASDALWCGVPLVTCQGAGFPGRVAASILGAIGLDELITENLADYEKLALQLATDAPRLAALKEKLAANRSTTPLFDTARFTRAMEAAFERMREGFLTS